MIEWKFKVNLLHSGNAKTSDSVSTVFWITVELLLKTSLKPEDDNLFSTFFSWTQLMARALSSSFTGSLPSSSSIYLINYCGSWFQRYKGRAIVTENSGGFWCGLDRDAQSCFRVLQQQGLKHVLLSSPLGPWLHCSFRRNLLCIYYCAWNVLQLQLNIHIDNNNVNYFFKNSCVL